MSYILDALRKADAQRERDPARGIHAQPLHASAGPLRRPGGWGPGLWIAAAAGAAALSLAAWYAYRTPATGTPGQPQRVETAARVAAAGAALAQTQTAPVVGNTSPAPAIAAPAPVQPPPAVPVPAPAIQPPPVPAPPFTTPAGNARITSLPMMRGGAQPGTAPAPGTGSPAPLAGAPAAAAQAPSAPAPTTARGLAAQPALAPAPAAPPAAALPRLPPISAPVPPPPPTPPVSGLPPDAPKLVLSGGVYSQNPAQRMLIVNGQVFNEGSEVAPGVVLEAIKAKTVVLKFRGSRYTASY